MVATVRFIHTRLPYHDSFRIYPASISRVLYHGPCYTYLIYLLRVGRYMVTQAFYKGSYMNHHAISTTYILGGNKET